MAASVLATSPLAGGRCFELSTTPRFQGMAAERFDALLKALDAQQRSVRGIEGVVSSAVKTNIVTSELRWGAGGGEGVSKGEEPHRVRRS